MNPKHRFIVTAAALSILSLFLTGCSKDKSTNPQPNTGATPFDSGNMPSGRSFQKTFTTVGTTNYHCSFHPSMTGTVTVAASGTDSVLVEIGTTTTGFMPRTVTIKSTGYVRWVNTDGIPHTATSN